MWHCCTGHPHNLFQPHSRLSSPCYDNLKALYTGSQLQGMRHLLLIHSNKFTFIFIQAAPGHTESNLAFTELTLESAWGEQKYTLHYLAGVSLMVSLKILFKQHYLKWQANHWLVFTFERLRISTAHIPRIIFGVAYVCFRLFWDKEWWKPWLTFSVL